MIVILPFAQQPLSERLLEAALYADSIGGFTPPLGTRTRAERVVHVAVLAGECARIGVSLRQIEQDVADVRLERFLLLLVGLPDHVVVGFLLRNDLVDDAQVVAIVSHDLVLAPYSENILPKLDRWTQPMRARKGVGMRSREGVCVLGECRSRAREHH